MADLKASLCGELPNQDSAIPQEQLRALLERRGIVGDPDIPNAKARLAEQELRRNMYHNTQVMLKHYRDIVWALECFPSEVAQELDQPLKDLDALLSVVDTQVALGNAKLEHRLLSIRKSRLLLDRINEALTVLRHKPGNGELMYNIIFQTFITPDKPSHSDTQTLTFYNNPVGGVEILKVDANRTSKRIPNTTFEIRKIDDELIDTITTDKNGRAYLSLEDGAYYAVEIEAGEGYRLDDTPRYFEVEDGKTTTIRIENEAFSGLLIHKVDATTGEGIYGVHFLVYDSNRNPIGEYVSDDRGYQRWVDAAQHYQPGQRVLVRVLEVDRSDRSRPRVTASVKQAMENPYEKALKKYVVGNRYVGTVSMVDLNGVFVSLDGGIDCLCTYPKRGRPPRGARATVRILGINHENNRIWGVITHMSTTR